MSKEKLNKLSKIILEISAMGNLHRHIEKSIKDLSNDEDNETCAYLMELHDEAVVKKVALINEFHKLKGSNLTVAIFPAHS